MEKKVKDITIVSLSRGILGEDFVRHEVELGVKRLEEYGISVHFSTNARKGLAYIADHPQSRAQDLLDAFESNTDMIFCAVGGDDTYRLLPYLFESDALKKAVRKKIFLGFSDTTMNHLMLNKVGLATFYGQAFLPDVCELDCEMLPYTRAYFEELIQTGRIRKVIPSKVWYDSRSDFSPSAIGTQMPSHENEGFMLLQGPQKFEGKILGGCIDTIYDIFSTERYPDTEELCEKYNLFPKPEEWKGKILLLETSEETPDPPKYRKMLTKLKQAGVFDMVSGVLVGKPMDEIYFDEYNAALKEVIQNPNLPVVANINIGHSVPRCILPFGVPAYVDIQKQEITFDYDKEF